MNEHEDDGTVEIVFMKAAEYDINILTKSLSGDLHERHSRKMIGEKPEWFPRILKNLN